MMNKKIIGTGAILMAIAIILGAFAAHGLEKNFPEKMIKTFKTGAEYQVYHSFGLIILGILSTLISEKSMILIKWLFVSGILIFSGSLYIYVLTGIKGFALITPIGGLCFIAGWFILAFQLLRSDFRNKIKS